MQWNQKIKATKNQKYMIVYRDTQAELVKITNLHWYKGLFRSFDSNIPMAMGSHQFTPRQHLYSSAGKAGFPAFSNNLLYIQP